MKKYFLLTSIYLLLNFSTSFASVNANFSFADIVEKLTPTVVNISTTTKIKTNSTNHPLFNNIPEGSPFEYFFKDLFNEEVLKQQERTVTSLGSGFIISKEGHILTNNHVIQDADEIEITLDDNSKANAKIIGTDKKTDIAILKIETEKILQVAKFGDSDEMQVGDWILAIGNPFSLGGSVTAGIISARGRELSDLGLFDYIQTDAAINKGNSGGPMFNLDGKVIGINTAIYSQSGGNIGIGFAIPSNSAKAIINQLIENGSVIRGWLGVHIVDLTDEMIEALDLEIKSGAYIVKVTKDSPAHKAGILPDDIITHFNGKKIKKMTDLPKIVAISPIGKKIKIRILRNIEGKITDLTLTAKIAKLEETSISVKQDNLKENKLQESKEILGLYLINLDDNRKDYPQYDSLDGLIVKNFNKSKINKLSVLKKNDLIQKINQIQIKSIKHLEKELTKLKEEKKNNVMLTIKRGKNQTFILTLNINNH